MTLPEGEVGTLARELVAIPSHDDETAAGDHIERWLRAETEATITRDEVGNVLARRGGTPATVALVGHHDVVPPGEEQVTDDGSYRIHERNGRLVGRGAADMKGALAAAMCAFRDADRSSGGVLFASFVGEETGSRGARHALESGVAPRRAIVCEGSTGYSAAGVTDVAIAHKGRRAITITADGTAAHASEPDAGENAVYRTCEAIDILRNLDLPVATVLGQDISGRLTVTGIAGGMAGNVVPDHCQVTVDERTVPIDRVDLSPIEAIEEVTWTVDQEVPPMACSDDPFADTVLTVACDAQAGTPEHVVKPHATDAGWLGQSGSACVVCGPAEPGEAHTAGESVDLKVLNRCYRIYRGTVEALAG